MLSLDLDVQLFSDKTDHNALAYIRIHIYVQGIADDLFENRPREFSRILENIHVRMIMKINRKSL